MIFIVDNLFIYLWFINYLFTKDKRVIPFCN